MKRIVFALVAILGVFGMWVAYTPIMNELPKPKGTIIVDKEEGSEEERHQEKQAWLDGMKKAAPGVNVDQIEHDYRFARQKKLAKMRSTSDSLAGGKVIGTFNERGCNFNSGRVMNVEWDTINDLMYVQTAGGILFSGPEDGSDWQPVNEQFRMEGGLFIRLVEHNGGQRLLSGTDGWHFYYSDDFGVTWDTAQGMDPNPQRRFIRDVVMLNDSSHTLYLLATEWAAPVHHTLYMSTDHGANFVSLATFPESRYGNALQVDLWAHRYANAAYMYLADSIFELKSDSTRIFKGTVGGVGGNSLITGHVSSSGAHTLYAYTSGEIHRSIDSGATWAFQGMQNENPFRRTSFEASVIDDQTLYFGSVECFRSFNRGQNWFKVNNWYDYYGLEATKLHADIPAIQSFLDDNGNEVTLISTDASFYRSDNEAITVSNLGLSGLNISRIYDHYTYRLDPNVIYVGTQDQGYQKVTTDNGGILEWNQEISGDYGWIVSSDEGYNIWMNYPGFTAFWEDAPFGFAQMETWDFNGANHFWIPPLMADPSSSYTAYIATKNPNGGSASYMTKLEMNGVITATQMPKDFGANNGGNITAMASSPIDPSHWYVLTDAGRFYHSSDSGVNWTRTNISNAPGTHYFYGMALTPSLTDLGTVYIGGSGYSNPPVYKTTNHGTSFSDITNGLPPTLVHELASDENDSLLFAATEVGAFVYVTSEDQWYDLSLMGAPDVNYWSVEYLPALGVARFGTHARGLWDLNLTQPGIGLTENDLNDWKIFPNPSNGVINFSEVSRTGVVYDMNGRLIERWETDRSRLDLSPYPTGVYIVKTEKGTRRVIKN